jgi:hypothetical protein
MFVWRYLGADGNELGESHPFPDRDAAEVWMGEAWAGLFEQGVEDVELVAGENGRPVFRMSLTEEPVER